MEYRALGSTGYRVSRLGFGAMRLPMVGEGDAATVNRDLAIPMIHRAFERGINYIDTARGYCNQDSQRAVGEALESWPGRDEIVVSTKNPYFGDDKKEWWTNLENSLRRLRVETIDIYNIHAINWERYTKWVEPHIWEWIQSAKDQGLIRHICCSFHDENDALVKIVDTGRFESVTLQYNMLDRRLEDGIAHAHKKGMGVVVMGPVGGGRLAEPSKVMNEVTGGEGSITEMSLKFVFANPHVTMALSGMSTTGQVEDNIRVADDTTGLTPEQLDGMKEHLERLKRMADLYCTGCGYCMPCPQDVNIPRIFQLYNQARVYDIWNVSKEAYSQLGKVPWEPGKPADACVECGACTPQCPQNIDIPAQLAEARKTLTS